MTVSDFGSEEERSTGPAGRGPGWNEHPASGFPGQAWQGSGQVPLGAPVMVGARAPGPVGASSGTRERDWIHRRGSAPARGRRAAPWRAR